MCVILCVYFINLVYSDNVLGTLADALAYCPSNITTVDGMHNSTYAYTATTSVSNLADFDVDDVDVSDVSSTEYDFIVHSINVNSDSSSSTSETINKTLDLFNTSYSAEFHIKHSGSYEHTIYINESSRNTDAIFKITQSNTGFINTVLFNKFSITINQLYHPFIYSEYGTKDNTGIKLLNVMLYVDVPTSISSPYLIGGASLSIYNSEVEIALTKLFYVTNFLSIKSLTLTIFMYEEYDPFHAVITFNHTNYTDGNYYVSVAGLLSECNPIRIYKRYGAEHSWDYLLSIDTRKLNASNMCGINHYYGSRPILDINRYGLDYSSYSFYNFTDNISLILSTNVSMNQTNPEYLRGYIIQMLRPLARRYEVLELNETVYEILEMLNSTGDSSEYNDSVIQELKNDIATLNDLVSDTEESISSINNTLNDVIANETKMSSTLENIITNETKMSSTLENIVNNISSINTTLNNIIANETAIGDTLENIIANETKINNTLNDIINDMLSIINAESTINKILYEVVNNTFSINETLNDVVSNESEMNETLNDVINDVSTINETLYKIIDELDISIPSTSEKSTESQSDTLEIITIVIGIVVIIHIILDILYCCITHNKKNNPHNTYDIINT